MKKEFLSSRAAFFLSGALCACLSLHCGKEGEKQDEVSAEIPVTVVSPCRLSITEFRTMNANTVFLSRVTVRSPFQGYVVRSFKSIGDSVRAGDILFRMQTKEVAAVDSAKISAGDPFISRFIDICARVNGIVTEINYHPGDYVADGDQLAKIGEPSSLRIVLNVPYPMVKDVRAAADCLVNLPGGGMVHAVVDKFIPTVDPSSQTQTVVLKVRSAVSLPENLNLIVRFPARQVPDAIVLPKQSVLSNETQSRFWIMKAVNDSLAVRVDVVKGIESDSLVQIREPRLNLTDNIVLDGGYGLPDSAKIILR
jgi:multidrug efflux pump subunit AcrA (membrane-fusion protein)